MYSYFLESEIPKMIGLADRFSLDEMLEVWQLSNDSIYKSESDVKMFISFNF